eukprot:CAMPEP_0113269494 /NCGR_PEP_ID=MMETSP0008_2-20120614/21748_1 /TAXON_ID=97485 /ORGANISM="Prymnesium parvum" /LENGTH=39 /DNA_ID=CAMNT_0000118749 /DNA_START=183 /DNA_END=298 /DNA_ORIENTATION=+ /assembly_acc=CAM_ASM_000153
MTSVDRRKTSLSELLHSTKHHDEHRRINGTRTIKQHKPL